MLVPTRLACVLQTYNCRAYLEGHCLRIVFDMLWSVTHPLSCFRPYIHSPSLGPTPLLVSPGPYGRVSTVLLGVPVIHYQVGPYVVLQYLVLYQVPGTVL